MCYGDTTRLRLGYDEENKPKRRETRRLGNWYVFFFLTVFFFYANHIYKFYRYYGVTEGLAGGYDGENGPKRRETRCLGHSVSIFKFYSCFL